MSQTLATTAGQNYLLSLWLYDGDGATPNQFLVVWNGTTLFNQSSIGAIGWTNIQYQVTATGASTVLEIGFLNSPSWFGLDDIAVYPLNPAPIITSPPASTNVVAGGAATSASAPRAANP